MAKRYINAVLILSISVPLIIIACVVVILVMVLPNSGQKGYGLGNSSEGPEGPQLMGDKNTKEQEHHMLRGSVESGSSSVLFIIGLIFACGLFVFLIVIIVVVCIWARQARGYKIEGDHHFTSTTSAAAKDYGCQLTHHQHHTDTLKDSKQHKEDPRISISREDTTDHSTCVSLPHQPVKTVAVPAQVSCKERIESILDTDPYQNIDESDGQKDYRVSSAQNYGSLSRTRILPSVDEEGYHLDNLGYEFGEIANREHFLPSFDDVESPTIDPEECIGHAGVDKIEEGSSKPINSPDSPTQEDPLQRQLSKQDSFVGLPPFKSFDSYLTLVRLDSTTSLESSALEEARKQWQSIEEENENEDEVGIAKTDKEDI